MTQFRMTGCREVVPEQADNFNNQVKAIERAIDEKSPLAFDLAKTLIETACRTIHNDLGKEFDKNWDIPKLMKETMSLLPMAPDNIGATVYTAPALKKTIGGLSAVIQGIAEQRNLHGFASHGKDAYELPVDAIHAKLAALSADAIVNYMYALHQSQATATHDRIHFHDFKEFNEWLDESSEPFRIAALEFPASETLYAVHREAYKDLLTQYEAGLNEGVNE